jgi:DNA topoisomerase VI subunit B
MTSTSMTDILSALRFRFYDHSDSKTKIPSVIIVNIVSPRVDYHGHDKSRIDTHAFSETIIEAAKKIAAPYKLFVALVLYLLKNDIMT